jgi:FkbH-like protein
VVLAAVSRNAPDIVAPLLQSGRLLLSEADFVAVIPSYNAKSAQIRLLAEQLNLGLDAFVFVDDNPVELAEVARELPLVRRVPFPDRDDDLPRFLAELTAHFPRTGVTAEDRERTALYRRRLEGMVPAGVAGADLTDFLRGLEMALTLRDCTNGDRARAVQLINKTNQFNINGRRIADEDVGKILAAGGKLYTALLEDRTGSHGEILACLIDADGVIRSLVMSCRVFQRRVEYAFFTWLAGRSMRADRLQFAATDRNEPLRTFLESPAFSPPDENGVVQFDSARFTALHGSDLDLFRVRAIES